MVHSVALEIPHVWKFVSRARLQVEDALASYPSSLRSAAIMTTSELVENAIKYGEEVPSLPAIRLRVTADEAHIRIEVANGVTAAERVQLLCDRLDEIARSSDKEELYMNRIRALLDDPKERGGLGLYRIGFEGAFAMTCAFVDSIVTVSALRRVTGMHEHGIL